MLEAPRPVAQRVSAKFAAEEGDAVKDTAGKGLETLTAVFLLVSNKDITRSLPSAFQLPWPSANPPPNVRPAKPS